MAGSSMVAADAMEKALGVSGAGVVAGLIIVSAFGATQNNLLTNARIVFAMGEGRAFFPWTGKVHPRWGTPGNSMLVIGVWSMLFVLSGSFDVLADIFVFMAWVFYGLTAIGLFILRWKRPHVHRPYRAWGYPLAPLAFIVFTLFYLGTTLYNDITAYSSGKSPIINSVLGLLLTATGVPFYWYFQLQKRKT
jgi:APA family basic amino acid/polyamine antiporter